jgi:beta-galactosidase GanA
MGHDVKLMLYMPWREWDYQPLHWGALVDLDGRPTPRLAAAAKIGNWIKTHETDLMAAQVPQAGAALLESKKNAIFFRGVDQDEDLFLAQRGAYRALWEQGYGVDFINPGLVRDGTINNYPQVILPMMGLIERETAEALADYVQKGGLLIGFARCGTLDENGWFYHHWPYAPLGDAFGIETIEPDTLEGQMIDFAGKRYSAHWNRDLLTLKSGTEVLATFEDGRPALTLAQFGKGWGLYIATQADSGALATDEPILKNVLAFVQARIGLSPRIRVLSPASGRPDVDPHLLELPGRTYLFVTDYLLRNKEVRLVLKDQRRLDRIRQVYPETKDVDGRQEGDRLTLSYQCGAKEVKIFQIDWA